MSRPKQKLTKDHITATIDKKLNEAIEKYRKDPKNKVTTKRTRSDGTTYTVVDMPAKSWIIQQSLEGIFLLKEYLT